MISNKKTAGFYIKKSNLYDLWDKKSEGRESINISHANLIPITDDFKNEIRNIRKQIGLNKLINYNDDIYFVEISNNQSNTAIIEESRWLNDQPQEVKKIFDNKINKIIYNYGLSNNFYDWLKNYILYKRIKYKPIIYNTGELVFDLINNPKIIQNIGLTAKEKKSIKNFVRRKLNISTRGRSPKKYINFIKKLDKILNKIKSPKKRKYRTFNTAILTNKLGEKIIEKDMVTFEEKKITTTYNNLVTEAYPESNDDDDKKLRERLKKQKQRLNLRKKTYTTKFK